MIPVQVTAESLLQPATSRAVITGCDSDSLFPFNSSPFHTDENLCLQHLQEISYYTIGLSLFFISPNSVKFVNHSLIITYVCFLKYLTASHLLLLLYRSQIQI